MNELIRHIADSFYNNRDEFLIEILRIFHKNGYTINERTEVDVKGYFDEELCRPFSLRFQQMRSSIQQFSIDTILAEPTTL